MDFLTSLSYRDSLICIVGAGLASHLVFKRTETHEPIYVVALLLVVPTLLTALVAVHASSVLSALFTSFSAYWATLATSITIYRVSPWHPLAKYPGPLICKISKFYFALLSLRGKQYLYYDQLHAKYGDVVRVGPNELSIRDPAAVVPMLGPGGLPKGPFWDGRIPEQEKVRPMISIRDNTEHTRRRRPWTRAFSSSALEGYEAMVTNRCIQLVEQLATQVGAVDMSRWISFFTYDFMNDLAFGGGSEMMRDGDVEGLWHLLDAGQQNAIFMSHVPWLGALFLRMPDFFAKDLKAFRSHAQKRAIMRKKQGSPHKDLFHYLIDEDGVATNPPSVVEVVSDGGLAIIAGSDTTSSAVANLFYFLLSNPVTYKRLRAEIDELGDNVMDYNRQMRLPYLTAVINEALRLLPPVLSGTQRAPEPGTGGKAIGPYFIPEGTSTFTPFFCLHRDPRSFSPLAESFVPERWLPTEKQIELEPAIFKDQSNFILNTAAFIPFSMGPSNCVGRNLAWMEMRMLVCIIMSRFDMSFEKGYRPKQWEDDMCDYFVMMRGKLPVVLTARK